MTQAQEIKELKKQLARCRTRDEIMSKKLKILYDDIFSGVPSEGKYTLYYSLFENDGEVRDTALYTVQELLKTTGDPLVWAVAKDLETFLLKK